MSPPTVVFSVRPAAANAPLPAAAGVLPPTAVGISLRLVIGALPRAGAVSPLQIVVVASLLTTDVAPSRAADAAPL